MKKHLMVTGSLLLSSALTFGAGYQLNLQGLRQLAMGGSGTAVPWDMATIFYNPGGLARIDHFQANVSALAVMPKTAYIQNPGVYSTESQSQTFIPFNVYIGAPVSYKSPVSIGVGVYTPFGTGIKWDDNWRGRYLIQDIKLSTVFIQPTVSYRISDAVSLGVGVIYAIGKVDMNRAIPLQNATGQDGKVNFNGNGSGWGFNVGLHWEASERVQLGLTYRSKVNMDVDRGYAQFTVPTSLASSFPYTPFSTTLPLPTVVSAGVGFKATDQLTLQADVNVVGWSSYKSLSFDFENNTPLLTDMSSPRRYKTTFAVRGGANYDFSDKVAGMIGAAWDRSPVRNGYVSPELPDADRGVFTGGITFRPAEHLTITGAVEFVTTKPRVASFDAEGFSGTYRTTAFTPGIGISLDF